MVDVEQIKSILDEDFLITGHVSVDPQLGVVDVTNTVILAKSSDRLPVQFGKVGGDFLCRYRDLNSLTGAPRHVGGNFLCQNNNLRSLAGAPHSVNGEFVADENQLTTLEGGPRHVGGHYRCSDNQLISLEGAPSRVNGHFWCFGNPLSTLDGAPTHVEGTFWCDYHPTLPLLRLLQYKTIHVSSAPDRINQVLQQYKGQGKKGMLGAGVELARAGYKDNARW
jgi:hypothetical protein